MNIPIERLADFLNVAITIKDWELVMDVEHKLRQLANPDTLPPKSKYDPKKEMESKLSGWD